MPVRRAVVALSICVCCCGLALGARAQSHDLLQHLTFDDMRPYEPPVPDADIQAWRVRDHSVRRWDNLIAVEGDSLTSVPGPQGMAARSTIMTDGGLRHTWTARGVPTDGLSILAWVRVEGSGSATPFGALSSQSDWALYFSVTADWKTEWRAWQEDGARSFRVEAPPAETDEWIHYAGIYDGLGATAVIYVDGVEVSRAVASPSISGDWGGLDGGGVRLHLDPVGAGSAVSIDDVNVWNRPLSRAEIRSIMDDSVPLSVLPVATVATTWGTLRQR